ncbi:SGNH/GDSL hydrolase family protein [Microbacterium sp. X-17]|uniref:SGNH/GDSL hydrolase family protein n=1 Tax=Microbacterium sp. X-17 TaxID=3144404 RepID=UPI0031F57595
MISPRRIRALVVFGALSAVTALAGCSALATPAVAPVGPVASAPDPTPTPTDTASPSVAVADPTWTSTAPTARIVTIGDSLMSGYGLSAGDAWPDLIAASDGAWIADLACAGMGFVADGDCGTTYAGMIPAATAIAPDVIIIQSSDNDSLENPGDVYRATLDTINSLRGALPNTRLICLGTLWSDTDIPEDVQMTTAAIQTAAAQAGCEFVDIGQPLAGHPEWYQEDEEHPNSIGQQLLASAIAAQLGPLGVFAPAS